MNYSLRPLPGVSKKKGEEKKERKRHGRAQGEHCNVLIKSEIRSLQKQATKGFLPV